MRFNFPAGFSALVDIEKSLPDLDYEDSPTSWRYVSSIDTPPDTLASTHWQRRHVRKQVKAAMATIKPVRSRARASAY